MSLDRANLVEGTPVMASTTFASNTGQTLSLALDATVNRPPVIEQAVLVNVQCSIALVAPGAYWQVDASAPITDESPGSATLSITGPGGRGGSSTQALGPNWGATVGNASIPDMNTASPFGPWNWSVVATDVYGNSTSATGTAVC